MIDDVTAQVRRARRSFWMIGVLLPLAALLLAELLVITWLPALPDPVATHWGAHGVDGFGPAWSLLVNPLIGAVVVGVFAGIVLLSSRMTGVPSWSPTARFFGALSLAMGIFIAGVVVVTTAVQRDVADAADALDVAPGMLAATALACLAGVAGWFLQPSVRTPPATPAAPTALAEPLRGDERAAWFGSVAMARTGWIVLGVSMLVLIGSTVLTIARAERDGWGPAGMLIGLTVLLTLLIGTMTVFRVRADARGLRVRSVLRWPRTEIPLAEIEKVQVVDVNPFAEFGGWGWRLGVDGRRGMVMRSGEALQVTRSDGRVFVVTVDGAGDAAAVLESLRAPRADER